ncbi:hypothetical protein J3B02_002102 [Coemansia erecta]|nr:hypothetical protein J3B02_002102 [Coemansia erecta]
MALCEETVADVADLVDARILIDITIEADPEYFSTASLVLSSHRGEANLDGLAQLARLLLRYFEQGLGRQISRDSIPGVDSLCAEPFDDLWRLVVLVVSATLLSERNGASEVYDGLDSGLQKVLKNGMDDTWGKQGDYGRARGTNIADLASSEVSRLTGSGDIRLAESEAQTGGLGQNASSAGPSIVHSHANSNDDSFITSGRSSFQQQFHSAYSSISVHNDNALRAGLHEQSMLSSKHEPAMLDVISSQDRADLESIASIASTDVYRDEYGDEYSEEGRGSMAGFEIRRSQQIGAPDNDSNEGTDDLADSYVSEFSQDLLQYGSDTVTMGFSGPNSFFAYLFVTNTIANVATGLYLIVTTQVPRRKSPYFKDFNDIIWAITQITVASVAAVVLSVVWMQLLRYQTRKVIWLTTLGIPVVSTATAVWVGTQILSIPGTEGLVGYRLRSFLVILIVVILAVRFIWSITRRRNDIERSVRVVSLACDVLALNKELYAFSLLLLAFYGAYAALAAIVASRLPLVQSLVVIGDSGWPTERLGLAMYLSLSFAWTSAVFVQLLRIIVSSVVCQWYFHRHDPGEPPALQTLQAATLSAVTRQFGTVALSATLLFIAKILHLIELVLRWIIGLLRVIPISLVSLVIQGPVYLADGWSSYTAVYAAFTGKGFFQASRTIIRVLRAHGLLHSPVVSLIRSSMTCYALLVSLVFGYSLGLRAIHLMSLHSAMVAVAGSLMPFALLQLVTHVLTCTVEALVVCYAIDLELDSCHSVDVAEAMAFT